MSHSKPLWVLGFIEFLLLVKSTCIQKLYSGTARAGRVCVFFQQRVSKFLHVKRRFHTMALFLESCASAAPRPDSVNLTITGLFGRQQPQVDGGAFSRTWVFVWEEINTLPFEGGEVMRSYGDASVILQKQPNNPRPWFSEATPWAKDRNVQKVTERDEWGVREMNAPVLCVSGKVSPQHVCLPDTQLGTRVRLDTDTGYSFRSSLSK